MVKPILISCLLLTCLGSYADSAAEEARIANACKPYLQNYNPNIDPDRLPAAAQSALITCSAHSSCTNSILSNPTTGIPDCLQKLESLQPNQGAPLVIITPKPATPLQARPAPTASWYIGSPPQQQSQQQQPQAQTITESPVETESTTTQPENTNQPLGTTTQPTKKPQKEPSINWF